MAKEKINLSAAFLFPECKKETVEIELPDGWRRVWSGRVLDGDRYVNCVKARCGEIEWLDIDTKEIEGRDETSRNAYRFADAYGLVIRRGASSPEKACEQCEVEPAEFGERYCMYCRDAVIRSQRARNRGL